MRGKPNVLPFSDEDRRITPACAGKTFCTCGNRNASSDHPRVCGENPASSLLLIICVGSPPRVRGKRISKFEKFHVKRITPACAGKTMLNENVIVNLADHPRVCGENQQRTSKRERRNGSPPRVRGKPREIFDSGANGRITPACAGKTVLFNLCVAVESDHPRVCGENISDLFVEFYENGSPPRVRGKQRLIFSWKE